jgi:hypothetical protein
MLSFEQLITEMYVAADLDFLSRSAGGTILSSIARAGLNGSAARIKFFSLFKTVQLRLSFSDRKHFSS